MNWDDYYLTRVNSIRYEKYFSEKYSTLMSMILYHINPYVHDTIIIEEGCGIGSVTKQLLINRPHNNYILMDRSKEMLQLAKNNLKEYSKARVVFKQKNILDLLELDPLKTEKKIVVTHGVLEHFSDSDIILITNTYSKLGITQFHYVPTWGYSTPSFGDERLLSPDYWQNITGFTEHTLVDDKDLYFKIK